MTLREYLDIIGRSWLLVVATTALGILGAATMSLLATPVYQATSELFVSVQTAEEISGAYTGGLYIQQRLDSYSTLVETPGVLEPVIDDLRLDSSADSLASQVFAQNPSGTVLLNVSATDTDPEAAAAIADATAKSLADEIVRLETTEAGSKPVKVELIQPARIPGSPSSPRTKINLALGALLGFLAGFGLAVLRATLDTSIKSTQGLQDSTDATVLGSVPYDSRAAKKPLISQQDGLRAEAYRTVRTNLKYIDVDNPPRCVVVTSSMPNEGKSTSAANLAIALAQGGANVILVEADLRRPRLAHYLGVDGSVGLTDVLIGRAVLGDAVVPWQRGLLDFLPAGAIPPNPSELLNSRHLADLLSKLKGRYDFVLLDAPPLLPVTDAAVLATVADGAILVARCGATRREQAEMAAAALVGVNGRLIGTILNFVPEKHGPGGYYYGPVRQPTAEGASKVVRQAQPTDKMTARSPGA